MILKIIQTDEEKSKAKYIVENYHAYVPNYRSVGRRIDWLVYDDDGFTLLGMIGIGSGVYPPPKDILHHLHLTKDQYKNSFNSFANNWRFCLAVQKKNLGTQVLKEFRKQAKIEWKKKYGNDLKYVVTFVGEGRNGAVYLADNWKMIGKTSGLPPHKSSSMKWNTSEELKKTFVKPVGGELQKLIFIKEL